ncbi:MAG: type IX secretion system membrane protein PorP/SprF [Cyclobacteriaceae bacterium]|nr:type IX secretion system membrane protein PorP/SprF [Cyclobacteriaceae bacterium]
MKKYLLSLLLLISSSGYVLQAQDIPLFSQKLTNSFVFNPAIAGHTYGSMTYSYKQNYSKVEGSPTNHFLSLHTPIANHRFGVGASIYQEDVTFLRNTYASGAFAYHLAFNKLSILSMGVSAEFNSIGTNGTPNFSSTGDQALNDLQAGRSNNFDFSFGLHYQNRFLKIGAAANRLSAGWIDKTSSLSYYYSGFAQGLIPIRGGEDLLEPYVAYQKLSEVNNTLSAGLYYTFDNKITAGAAMRSGQVLNASLAFRISKYVLLGYSREMITGNIGGFVGAANEFTLRYDFNDQSYKERFRADYKSALSYRRKTLSGPIGKVGSRSPKQIQRNQKKLAPYSPNKRYQNTKKLSVKTSSSKKNFSTKKRQKSNYKRKSKKLKKK